MEPSLNVRFWGVRGSVPSPGLSTARYGGNTSCVSIQVAQQGILVLDAGTGIRELGKATAAAGDEIFILLSHAHWDHIQGFPFFIPIYQPGRRIFMFPSLLGPTSICGLCQKAKAQGDTTMGCPLLDQMDGAHFPVHSEHVPSQPRCITDAEMSFLRTRGFTISRIATNHPGGGFGYKIENGGRTVVYLTDNELEPPGEKATEFDAFVEFCRNADVLIHDAQYVEADMPQKRGWGHSLVGQVRSLALAAGVKHLILYHHDPDRSDQDLDAIQDETRRWFAEKEHRIPSSVAFEGLSVNV